MSGRRLAIVGAGFSAISLLQQLVERGAPLDEVMLYGRADEFATGLAYGSHAVDALLNTRAAELGLAPGRPGDFADWAGLAGDARDSFLPRQMYGAYLRASLGLARARSRFPIRALADPVAAIHPSGRGFRLDAEGCSHHVDQVVLAIGALPPPALPDHLGALSGSPRFIDDPWRMDWLPRLRRRSRVVILGSGLSMVDHLQRIRAGGTDAVVTVVSRRGLWPQPHLPARVPAPPLSPRLEAAIEAGDLRALLSALRDECAAAAHWQAVMDALRRRAGAAWRALDGDGRRRFLRHLRPFWETHRHRLSPALHARIAACRDDGRVQIRAGRLLGARESGRALVLALRPRGGRDAETISADLVLRATGVEGGYRPGAVAAVDPLVAGGCLHPDPLGLGFAVDDDGRALNRDGRVVPGLYLLGAAARGRDWECTAIPELRRAAERIAIALSG